MKTQTTESYSGVDDDRDDDSAIPSEMDPRFDGMTEAQLCEVHDLAMKRWRAAEKAWEHAHKSYTDDQKFANGEQWDTAVADARTKANLSVLVYNQLPSKYKYIVNNARRAVPGIKCSPVRGGATKNTAKIFDGLVMSIQQRSNAKNAYIHALTCAVIGGLGAWRVTPVQDDDGDTDISVDRILDPTSVFFDPAAIKQDFSDAEYTFLKTWVPKELFEAENGEEAEGISTEKSTTDMFTAESVLVLEYWVRNRETKRIEQYVMNGTRVLQAKRNYLGGKLPVVLVTGEEKHIDGHREYKGIVRDVKDMQILLNLSKSKTADYLGRTGNQTWLVEEDQIEGYEDIWLGGNVSGAAVLPYKATAGGKPDRLEAPPPPAGFQQISSEADSDIRSAIGIRDPLESLPANIAGKTLELQVSQSNIGTLEFIDRLKDAIKQCGQIIVDLIPKYLNYAHVREIVGPDGQVRAVPLNQAYEENGQQVMHDLTLGKYAVTISDGPSYESQRSEASDKLLECAKVYPQFMQLAGDIVFRNMDFDGASEIADRLRAQIPPNILAASSSSNADGVDNPQVAQNQLMQLGQQLQQMAQENQQLHQFLQQAQQEAATKQTEIQVKMQAEIELETLRHRNAMELKQLELQGRREQIGDKGAVDSTLQQQRDASAMERDILSNHTDIFKAELKHNAANVTPLDDVPVVDPLAVAADIAAEITPNEMELP